MGVEGVSDIREGDDRITHGIIDRPSQHHHYLNREYIQPQWVYDSANLCFLIPPNEYLPGATLPPHLSPFVDDKARGYVPARREQLNALITRQAPQASSASIGNDAPRGSDAPSRPALSEEEQLRMMEEQFARGLQEERGEEASPAAAPPPALAAPKTRAEKRADRRRRDAENETEEERRALMLSKKQKRRWARKQKNVQAKEKEVRKLEHKRASSVAK